MRCALCVHLCSVNTEWDQKELMNNFIIFFFNYKFPISTHAPYNSFPLQVEFSICNTYASSIHISTCAKMYLSFWLTDLITELKSEIYYLCLTFEIPPQPHIYLMYSEMDGTERQKCDPSMEMSLWNTRTKCEQSTAKMEELSFQLDKGQKSHTAFSGTHCRYNFTFFQSRAEQVRVATVCCHPRARIDGNRVPLFQIVTLFASHQMFRIHSRLTSGERRSSNNRQIVVVAKW